MKPRLPDFLIAGAPRAGTTWLYHLLDRHPDVFMAKPSKPEPKFFLIDELYELGIKYYAHTWFSDVGDGQVCGEKSTNYLESAQAAIRIKKNLPNVRLIFILREPVDRAVSNYQWSCMNNMETQDFATAISLEEKRQKELPEELKYARPHAFFSRGLYANLLAPYFDLFPRKQILCLKFEDIIHKPKELTKSLHRFLEISPCPTDMESLGIINASSKRASSIPPEVRDLLKVRYAEPNRRLAKLLGSDFEMWETK